MRVIDSGKEVDAGRSGLVPFVAVAAFCCCTLVVFVTFQCQCSVWCFGLVITFSTASRRHRRRHWPGVSAPRLCVEGARPGRMPGRLTSGAQLKTWFRLRRPRLPQRLARHAVLKMAERKKMRKKTPKILWRLM